MADRPALWRWAYVATAARGWTAADVLTRLPWPNARSRLARLLLGRRGREAYVERGSDRVDLAAALGLPPSALADGARWTLTVETPGGERVVLEV